MSEVIFLSVEVRRHGVWKAVRPPGDPGKGRDRSWYWDLSSTCFAVLADVRNGAKDDGYIKPIAPPRGLPTDRDREVWRNTEEYGHGWLLLSEILAYDWDQKTHWRGWLSQRELHARGGRPLPYPSGPPKPALVYGEWEKSYREECGDLFVLIEGIRDALPGVDPEQIRLVFSFAWW